MALWSPRELEVDFYVQYKRWWDGQQYYTYQVGFLKFRLADDPGNQLVDNES